jgi:hypothetical protein
MTARTLYEPAPAVPRGLRWTLVALLFAWTSLWLFFVVASHFDEPEALAVETLAVAAPLVALALLAWRKPLFGGIGLFAAGVAAAFAFQNAAAYTALALPAMVFGAAFFAIGLRERRRARA